VAVQKRLGMIDELLVVAVQQWRRLRTPSPFPILTDHLLRRREWTGSKWGVRSAVF
jgi:hypothetical protein